MARFGRREFVKTAAAACGASALPRPSRADGDRTSFKVGFITDTHVGETRKSCELVKGAFEVFKAQGVQAIGHCGDLADWHYELGYKYYREAFESTYPDPAKRPEMLYVYANHDALNTKFQRDPNGPHKRFLDLRTAFAAMRKHLAIPHDLFHETVIGGVPFLVFPQTFDLVGGLKFLDEKIKETCARFPTGPVVLLTHLPPADTLYNSRAWGSIALTRIFEKYPRLVTFTGHTHGSLRNEQSIWQGAFTAVDVCCLQVWHGNSVGTPVSSKKAYGAIVADFHPDRIVLHRIDVRDGSEFKADDPWIVPLPFDPATAPYNWKTRAKTERKAEFPSGAMVAVEAIGAPADKVKVSFPGAAAEEDVLWYQTELARPKGDGWETYARADIFGEFYKRPQERTGRYSLNFSSMQFENGADTRIRVRPVGFFGAAGVPLETVWKPKDLIRPASTWVCDDPTAAYPLLRHGWPQSAKDWENAKTVQPRADGWYDCSSGHYCKVVPAKEFAAPKGTRFRFAAELRMKQDPVYDGMRVSLSGIGKRFHFLTSPCGDAGLMRYVWEFTAQSDEPEAHRVTLSGGKALARFERFILERMP